jgi:hypothetical protein
VQQIQAEHVGGAFIEMERAANFALLEAMHQAGMNIKAYLLDYVQPSDSFLNSTAKADAHVVAGTTSFTASFGTGAEGPGPYAGACCHFEEYVGSNYILLDPKPVCGGLTLNSNAG